VIGADSHASVLFVLLGAPSLSLISFSTARGSVSKGVTRLVIWLPRDDRRDSSLGCYNAPTFISWRSTLLWSLLTFSLFSKVSSMVLGALALDWSLMACTHWLVLYTPATIVRSNRIDLCIVVLISKFIILN